MDVNVLVSLVTLLAALSVASERLVEVVKGIVPFLNAKNEDATKEGWRKAALQVMAVVAGILTTLLAQSALGAAVPASWQSRSGVLAVGLLTSGGSGFWNAILSYVLQVKDLKKLEATDESSRQRQIPAANVLRNIVR